MAGSGEVTFIHIGDLHGHLIPRPNMREGDPDHGLMVGGVAYVYDQIKKIRKRKPNSLLINTGDTIQGSAEALYTSGHAMVDILNDFKIDAFAPGNWDFVYGTESFRELFAGADSAFQLVSGGCPSTPANNSPITAGVFNRVASSANIRAVSSMINSVRKKSWACISSPVTG